MIVRRYQLELVDDQTLELPNGAVPISAGLYKRNLVIFATIPDDAGTKNTAIRFVIAMTGPGPEGIGPEGVRFLGTVAMGGGYHRHVFVVES